MRRLTAFTFMLTYAVVAAPASAQTLRHTHGHWQVYSVTQTDGIHVCYIASKPVRKGGQLKERSQPYVLVTHRGGDQGEVSVFSGYPYAKGSAVEMTIGRLKESLFTQGSLSWTHDVQQDASLIHAMKRGSRMTVRARALKGGGSADTYSLSGFTAAFKRMRSLCP